LKISVIVPAHNEAPNLATLIDEMGAALNGRDAEVIIVDDGSTDNTGDVVAEKASAATVPVRYIRHTRPAGQSLALRTGVFAAAGEVIATIDGDGQNDPKYIPVLVDTLLGSGPEIGIVGGRRLGRKASGAKRLASGFANRLRRAMLHDDALDSGCGLKALRTDLFRRVPFFDGTHRFLPALVRQEGFGIVHCDVMDRPREHGSSHYGILDRGMRGWVDLMGVAWLRRRRRRIPRPEDIRHD